MMKHATHTPMTRRGMLTLLGGVVAMGAGSGAVGRAAAATSEWALPASSVRSGSTTDTGGASP